MARGGSRPGAGRPRKNAPKKPIPSLAELPPREEIPETPRVDRPPVGDDLTGAAKDLLRRLLAELDAVTMNSEEIEACILEETAGDLSIRRRNLMLHAVSLPTRASTLKTIVDALARTAPPPAGKKEQQAAVAAEVSRGRFAPSAAPRLSSVK